MTNFLTLADAQKRCAFENAHSKSRWVVREINGRWVIAKIGKAPPTRLERHGGDRIAASLEHHKERLERLTRGNPTSWDRPSIEDAKRQIANLEHIMKGRLK